LVSRNGHRFRRFDALANTIAAAVRGRRVVLDGEIVCLGPDGRSLFDALFYRRSEPYFYAFDLLALDGRDLRRRPLLERKRELRALLARRRGRLRYLTHVRRAGIALYQLVCDHELPPEIRGAMIDVLGYECADYGLTADERLNAYGRELDALVAAIDDES